jgi:hypothetical protein
MRAAVCRGPAEGERVLQRKRHCTALHYTAKHRMMGTGEGGGGGGGWWEMWNFRNLDLMLRPSQCTALHCTALHCTALHCTALHCAALYLGTATLFSGCCTSALHYTALPGLHTAHCTLHTAHCTLHTTHCTLHTAHCTLLTVYYTLHTAH